MRRGKFRRPCKVFIFNGARVLVAIVRSLHSAAELTHENKSQYIIVAPVNQSALEYIITANCTLNQATTATDIKKRQP